MHLLFSFLVFLTILQIFSLEVVFICDQGWTNVVHTALWLRCILRGLQVMTLFSGKNWLGSGINSKDDSAKSLKLLLLKSWSSQITLFRHCSHIRNKIKKILPHTIFLCPDYNFIQQARKLILVELEYKGVNNPCFIA